MKTITAVELRKNMGEIIARVQGGEVFAVTYRGGKPVSLIANTPPEKKNKSGGKELIEALNQAALKAKVPERYKTGNLKELYYEDMAKKYGLS